MLEEKKMYLRDKVINDLENQIEDSEKKLEYLTGSERTRELYHCANLNYLLRKTRYVFRDGPAYSVF